MEHSPIGSSVVLGEPDQCYGQLVFAYCWWPGSSVTRNDDGVAICVSGFLVADREETRGLFCYVVHLPDGVVIPVTKDGMAMLEDGVFLLERVVGLLQRVVGLLYSPVRLEAGAELVLCVLQVLSLCDMLLRQCIVLLMESAVFLRDAGQLL